MRKNATLLFSLALHIIIAGSVFSQDYIQDTLAVRAILNANGLTPTPVASVTDSSNGRITALNLGLKGLTTLSSEIGGLTELLKLSLEVNSLSILPTEIGNLTKLEELLLYTNNLSSLPSALGNLTKLKVLWVSGNILTTLPTEIGNLSALKRLIVFRNSIFSLPGSLTSLKPTEQCDFGFNNLNANSLSNEIKTWLDQYDPNWQSTQTVPIINFSPLHNKSRQFSLLPNKRESPVVFSLPAAGFMRLEVLDIKGRTVSTLLNTYKSAGIYSVNLNYSKFGSGVYYLRLTTGNISFVRKAAWLK